MGNMILCKADILEKLRNQLEIRKSVNESLGKDAELEYFKRELLRILDAQEEREVRKAENFLDFYDDMVMKGRLGTVGEIRTWQDGHKYKKMPNKKWVRVYDTSDKHAENSIARLKGRVRRASSIDELFDIVMSNTHRFSGADGKPLDIVKELKEEVDKRKKTLNAGKPSTQKQIEEFYAKRNYAESQFEIGKNINDEELKNILTAVKHSQTRNEYINDYYLSRLDNYETKEIEDSDGYRGKVTVSKDRKENQDEKNAALFFQKKGCDVVMLSESQRKTGEKHPDLLVNGVLVEVKTCKESNANGIATEIKNAINKRNTEIATVFLFDKSAKEDYKDIINNLNKKKDYLVADVNAIMLIKGEVVTLVDKKNTAGFQKEVPSATNNIPANGGSVNKITAESFPERFRENEDMQKVISFMQKGSNNEDLNYIFSNLGKILGNQHCSTGSKNFYSKGLRPNYSWDKQTVVIEKIKGDNDIDGIETAIHEMTHAIDYAGGRKRVIGYHSEQLQASQEDAELRTCVLKNLLKKLPEKTLAFFSKYENIVDGKSEKTRKDDLLVRQGEQIKKDYADKKISREEATEKIEEINKRLKANRDFYDNKINEAGIGHLEDIYDALSGGKFFTNGLLTQGHGNTYKKTDERSSEILANYVALSFTQPELIENYLRKDVPNLCDKLDSLIKQIADKQREKLEIQKAFIHNGRLYIHNSWLAEIKKGLETI